MSDSTIVRFTPAHHDVICRRGYLAHPGNKQYLTLLDRCALRHPRTPRDVDTLVDGIIQTITEKRHGRFLKPLKENKTFAELLNRKEAEARVRVDLQRRITKLMTITSESKTPLSPSKKSTGPPPTTAPEKTIHSPNRRVPTSTARPKASQKNVGHDVGADKSRLCGYVTGDDFDDDSHSSQLTPLSFQKFTAPKSIQDQPVPSDVSFPPSVATSSSFSNTMKRTTLLLPIQQDQDPAGALLYGSLHDEVHMRRWLNSQQLPQSVGDVLLELGARSVDDVSLLVKSQPTSLNKLAVLDLVKLHRAVEGK